MTEKSRTVFYGHNQQEVDKDDNQQKKTHVRSVCGDLSLIINSGSLED